MGGQELQNGGMNRKPICIPSQLKDLVIIIIYPPLWVFLKEFNKKKPFENLVSIMISFVLTCFFYFPGLIHAMSILRKEGTI